MQSETVEQADEGEVGRCYVLDNVQRNYAVHEGGLLVKPIMKVGCTATAVELEDCQKGAWDLSDYLSRVAQNLRSKMTIGTLWNSIDWKNYHDIQALYVVKTLVEYIPSLKFHSNSISERFRTHPIAIHRIPDDRRTKIQPLGTNSEQEVEIHGMKRCIEDFDGQIGFTGAGADDRLLEWVSGDGASFAAIINLQKYLAPTSLGNRETLRNKIVTPEIWHTKDKALKAIAEEHFGPPTSADPSSLSKLYTLAGLKRPSNLKHCDHYPTMRGLELIWTAQILDCWRITLGVEELQTYFENLDTILLPSLETLISQASNIVSRYISICRYNRVLSSSTHSGVKVKELKVDCGTPWTSNAISNSPSEQSNQNNKHFDGNRSLANSILFKMQFGSLQLLKYAIRDGDVGQVIQQLRIWIFMFAGSAHQQYTSYLLELHCLLEYDSSPQLRKAIMDNLLIKFGLGCQEKDITQEHHNGRLEMMVDKSGGDFNGSFYRQVIAPNVDNFIKCTKNWETAFDMKTRSRSHTSPNNHPELRALQVEIKSSELHLFRPGRLYPEHIATDLLTNGYNRLGSEGKLKTFITKSSSRAKFIAAIEKEKKQLGNLYPLQDIQMNVDSASLPAPELHDNDSDSYSTSSNNSNSSIEEPESEMRKEVMRIYLGLIKQQAKMREIPVERKIFRRLNRIVR
ncbi:hypothetical protein K435DRAFT_870254 [Dendrothele bispora CBS 962.96]|uniref:DUF6589 domain-containing protein n=1 Tax=Dendrothele bispora (strain CBS 962.96) TaxID=1314807 RepID=A0A4S8L7F3_DENBC|nr:hypothetical protein K435DRAFT_870254 [Dendrothele bispora CBS 962.96]